MKRRFELSLAETYVSNWGFTDAVREFIQNALDQQTVNPSNAMSITYEDGVLYISSKTAVLSTSTLLLGYTSKKDDDSTIGQFGEGYKIASLVLTREGKEVTVYNYGNKELWKARLSKSKKYGDQRILVFDVETDWVWKKVPNNNLTFAISNVTPEEWEQVKDVYLGLQEEPPKAIEDGYYGEILLDPKYKGHIYVSGLFVTDSLQTHYGYNFRPNHITLERDRRLADSWSVEYYASKIWSEVYPSLQEEVREKVQEMISTNAPDVRQFKYHSRVEKKLSTDMYRAFTRTHGTQSVPVVTQEQFNSVGNGYKAIIVSETEYRVLQEAEEVAEKIEEAKVVLRSTKQQLMDWRDRYCHKSRAIKELNKILEEMED